MQVPEKARSSPAAVRMTITGVVPKGDDLAGVRRDVRFLAGVYRRRRGLGHLRRHEIPADGIEHRPKHPDEPAAQQPVENVAASIHDYFFSVWRYATSASMSAAGSEANDFMGGLRVALCFLPISAGLVIHSLRSAAEYFDADAVERPLRIALARDGVTQRTLLRFEDLLPGWLRAPPLALTIADAEHREQHHESNAKHTGCG